jgi:hypothetical protein
MFLLIIPFSYFRLYQMSLNDKKSLSQADLKSPCRGTQHIFSAPEIQIKLSDLPIGARVLVRSRTDWRAAAISRIIDDPAMVVLTVSSPSGHSYRLRRELTTEVIVEGGFAILPADSDDSWRENFSVYDRRW